MSITTNPMEEYKIPFAARLKFNQMKRKNKAALAKTHLLNNMGNNLSIVCR